MGVYTPHLPPAKDRSDFRDCHFFQNFKLAKLGKRLERDFLAAQATLRIGPWRDFGSTPENRSWAKFGAIFIGQAQNQGKDSLGHLRIGVIKVGCFRSV